MCPLQGTKKRCSKTAYSFSVGFSDSLYFLSNTNTSCFHSPTVYWVGDLFKVFNVNSFWQFAPGFQVGDGIGMDLKLSNHVFNALKQHAYSEERRSARLHEKKEHSTAVSNLKLSSVCYSPPTRLVFQIKDVNKLISFAY